MPNSPDAAVYIYTAPDGSRYSVVYVAHGTPKPVPAGLEVQARTADRQTLAGVLEDAGDVIRRYEAGK